MCLWHPVGPLIGARCPKKLWGCGPAGFTNQTHMARRLLDQGDVGPCTALTNSLMFIVIPVIAICMTMAIAYFVALEVPVCFRTVV